jgi:formylglycine-generating enzyme required for sulfatase activity
MKKIGFSLFREGNEVKNRPTLPSCLFGQFSVVAALFASLFAVQVRAEWKTETYDLVTGWNAIYLHIDPSYDTIENLVNSTAIDQVWLWTPDLSSAQFITSVEDPITAGGDNWLAWVKNDANNSNLEKFIGNAAYLIHATANVELSLKGKVVPPVYTWTATGQNFLGFSTASGTEPTFSNFFGLAEDLDTSFTDVYRYPGGETGVSPVPSEYVAENDFVKRGEAFWVSDSDYNRFFGTFSITLQDLDGVHLGTSTSAYRIRLTNTSNESLRVTLEMVMSDSPAVGSTYIDAPPLLIRGSLDPTTFTYSFAALSDGAVSWDLNPAGEVGSSVEVVFGVDRLAMTTDQNNQATQPEDLFGGILRFTDNLNYTLIDVPTTAEVGSLAGLWVGEAKITQVQQALSEYEVDEDGETALNDDGSAVVSETDLSFGDVAQSFPLRLIMHRDESGTTRLLQRVYYGLDVPEDENDEPEAILATGQGLLNEDYLDTARRITSVHLPWSADNNVWTFDNSLDFVSTMSTTVSTLFDDQGANPFVHTYHPDHDNRSPLFEAYGDDERGFESYDIIREIALNAGTTLVTSESTTTSTSAESNSTTEAVEVPSLPAGIKMLGVPQGGFVMGNDDAVGPLAAAHSPERVVYMSPFEMSEAEITVQQYVDFLNAASADGMIEIREDTDGTYVVGAGGQPYAGLKFVELTGSRVLKDHDGDGDIDPENPLNQCWIEYDEDGVFSVKDPGAIDWATFEFVEEADLITSSEWTEAIPEDILVPADDPSPLEISDGTADPVTGNTYQLNGSRQIVLVDEYAFVVSSVDDTIHAIDVREPSSPKLLRAFKDSLNTPIHISTNGEYLFVCSYNEDRIRVFKISDLIDSSSTQGSVGSVSVTDPRGSAVNGNYLYTVGDDHLVRVFDITNPSSPVSEGSTTISHNGTSYGGRYRWIEIEDERAYVASFDDNSIFVLDLSTDPTDLTNVMHVITDGKTDAAGNTINFLGETLFLHIDDGILYVTGNEDAVSVFDVSFESGSGPVADNDAPVLIATMEDGVDGFELNNARQMVTTESGILYVATASADAVNVVDVRDPGAPQLIDVYKRGVGSIGLFDNPLTVAVNATALFVLSSTSDGLSIFELTRSVGTIPTEGFIPFLGESSVSNLLNGATDNGGDETFSLQEVRHVVASENVAYVADSGGDSISVLDTSDPQNVEILALIVDETDGYKLDNVRHLTLAGDLLVATSNQDGEADTFTLIDVSNPSSPTRFATITDNVQANNLNAPLASSIWSRYLFTSDVGGSDEDAISIFDISDPSDPELISEVISGLQDSSGQTYRVGNATSIPVVDGIAYVAATEQSQITILNVEDPTDVRVLAEIDDGADGFDYLSSIQSIVVRDGVLFCASAGTENAVTLIDVSDPSNPALLSVLRDGDGTYDYLNTPRRIAIANGLLYIPAEGDSALTVVDVADPYNPVLLEEIVDGQSGFEMLGGLASVAIDQELVLLGAATDQAVSIVQPTIAVGETIDVWPELTKDLPTEAEVSNWPAAFIKWHGAKSFAEYYGCDLPTEAQWEYAAKGGADYDFATGDGLVDATRANYNEYNFHPDTGHVEPVKTYAPNPFGFYDMSGNVWEWCRDWFDPDFYSSRPNPDYDPYNSDLVVSSVEPTEDGGFVGGPGQDYTGDARVKRGGSWNFHETSLHTAERERDYTWRGNDHFGFRVVRESYSIEPIVAADFDALTSSATSLSGTYQERITLIGKDDQSREYNVAGEFKLIRISEIDTLTTAE